MRRDRVLVVPAELDRLRSQQGGPLVLDVRWALGRSDGREQYRAGHVPGAVFVDLEAELAAPPSAAAGRHPLPDPASLQAAARRWGVRADQPVVVYDAVGGTSAARAWWLLRWAGHDDVRLLDGGLDAWTGAGPPTESGDVVPDPGDLTVRPGHMPVIDADGAADLAASGVLLDARAGERYRGETEPVDPRAGHVPGAVTAPTTANLDPSMSFLSTEALRDRFAGLGVPIPQSVPVRQEDRESRVGVYCGSGVTAAHEIAALAIVGVDAVLYPGSWSQWSNDEARPVAVGE